MPEWMTNKFSILVYGIVLAAGACFFLHEFVTKNFYVKKEEAKKYVTNIGFNCLTNEEQKSKQTHDVVWLGYTEKQAIMIFDAARLLGEAKHTSDNSLITRAEINIKNSKSFRDYITIFNRFRNKGENNVNSDSVEDLILGLRGEIKSVKQKHHTTEIPNSIISIIELYWIVHRRTDENTQQVVPSLRLLKKELIKLERGNQRISHVIKQVEDAIDIGKKENWSSLKDKVSRLREPLFLAITGKQPPINPY
ncbi:hypothetical protein [Aliikangiella coralliicola]|uniref:Uncharacterized protein n=1 Tax=Aliikangiella coralliicola TaxID=2592383 RepID=A0A545U8Z1_9GAMM|nr:hypothetical protein [Aliikangiella coralliicola]TQV85934.1 hypothetical protein FLL46_18625 [Aliikangiella coralliicola]